MNTKILVVDDDQLLLESLKLFLVDEGYSVESIDKAAMIGESISRFQPQIILMDIHLNDGDGRKICDDIKNSKNTSHIPIVLITALSYEEISEFDCSADAILGKPYNKAILLQTIADLV